VSASAGPRWLDALARRAARGEIATDASAPPVAAAARGGGLSRRTLLRAAGAAVLLGGPLRLLIPARAQADAESDCVLNRRALRAAAYRDCLKGPKADYYKYSQKINSVSKALTRVRTAAIRKRLLKLLDSATANRDRAAEAIETCLTQTIAGSVDAELYCCQQYGNCCQTYGGSGCNGSGGCPAGTHVCTSVNGVPDLCCYGSDVCCGCPGSSGGATCCVIEVGCACCG
jgi:hypothetical protein